MSGDPGSVGARLAAIADRLQARAAVTFGARGMPADVIADIAELQRLADIVDAVRRDLHGLDRDLASAGRLLHEGDQ